MFNWQASGSDTVLSSRFWICWAVTLPLTLMMFSVWLSWLQHLKGHEKKTLRGSITVVARISRQAQKGSNSRNAGLESGRTMTRPPQTPIETACKPSDPTGYLLTRFLYGWYEVKPLYKARNVDWDHELWTSTRILPSLMYYIHWMAMLSRS